MAAATRPHGIAGSSFNDQAGTSPPRQEESRPAFHLGQRDPDSDVPFTDLQYGYLLRNGVEFATAPITNTHFRSRVFDLCSDHLRSLELAGRDNKKQQAPASATPAVADPIVLPLTPDDTGLFPSQSVKTYTAWASPWIDLGSTNSTIAAVSRQVLNLELMYAAFCGVRNIVVTSPGDSGRTGPDIQQYARAIREALAVARGVNIMVYTPMCREGGSAPNETLATLIPPPKEETPGSPSSPEAISAATHEDDGLSCWDMWHQIRTMCNYDMRLYATLQMPREVPAPAVVDRWFCEPVNLLVIGKDAFRTNRAAYPSLIKGHQAMIFKFMQLRTPPWLLLSGIGLDVSAVPESGANPPEITEEEYPPLGQQLPDQTRQRLKRDGFEHVSYLRWLEQQQPARPSTEDASIFSYLDVLQSPLQPLSDNLESLTYEVFEGDPVKYTQYETAIVEALLEWKQNGTPTSSGPRGGGAIVLAVAGAGRGPLVSRALKASEQTGIPIQVWAVEKNPNAYVYLLRQNRQVWDGRVTVVKTDMRHWKGPLVSGTASHDPVYGKVDILVSELLGSFGDNELSPECLDGIQHVLALPHGISIPSSYTAHVTPISTPRIHADLLNRLSGDPLVFDTPWVVRLHQLDMVARGVPGRARFQQAWEFSHPVPAATLKIREARLSGGVVGGGGGAMAGAAGLNDHNARYCQLTFECPTRGVVHGLAGYFEATLFESSSLEGRDKVKVEDQDEDQDKDNIKVELSILPDEADHKSKDMTSWFPLFFPLIKPVSFPPNSQLTVSIWRQTNDTRVWYEWLVDAYTCVGTGSRIKVGSSDLCSSFRTACLL